MTTTTRFKMFFVLLLIFVTACGSAANAAQPQVLAVESFLADITRNVVGDRLTVDSLIPEGLDPHAFDPTPQDVARITDSRVLVVNGAGLEAWLQPVLENAGGEHIVIEAAAGLQSRPPTTGLSEHGEETDPHFWLDPLSVVAYVENIRAGLSRADPDGAGDYAKNAAAYTDQLTQLDDWIRAQIETIPPERRLMVTNHESFGYYADRYGLTIVGAIIPNASPSASPSAQELAGLIQTIRASGAPAIFLETGTNAQLAEQLAAETGIQVVTGLSTHSLTLPDGAATDYIGMMRYNTQMIVQALQ